MKSVDSRDDRYLEAWTFVEAIAVLAIMLILSGVVAVSAARGIETARRAAAEMEIQALSLSLYTYLTDTGTYPSTEQGLSALFRRPALAPIPEAWNGPYLDAPPSGDPWGRAYVYLRPGPDGLPFEIRSLGADGRPGGGGTDADISSAGTR